MKVAFKIINDLKVSNIKEEEIEQVLNETRKAKRDCESYIEASDRVKGSYFWTPASDSKGRRYQEEKYSYETEQEGLVFSYKFEVSVRVSARNFYVYKYTTINGNDECTLTNVKTFLKDLENLEAYLTQDDVEINFSKESKAKIAAEEALKESENLLYTELLKEFEYETLIEHKEEIDTLIIEKTIESLLELNKRQITAKKASEIQNTEEFVEELLSSLNIEQKSKKNDPEETNQDMENYLEDIAIESSSEEELEILSTSKIEEVRIAVACNSNASEETLEALAKDKSKDVRRAVAGYSIASEKTLELLAKDKYEEVRFAVARNLNTSIEILQSLSKDKSLKVSGAASFALEELQSNKMAVA